MLIDDILREAELPGQETMYIDPPGGVFCAWSDEIEADGSDFCNEVAEHNYTVELFEPRDAQRPDKHRALQGVLNNNGIPYHKSERIFYEDIQYFITTYTFGVVERIDL